MKLSTIIIFLAAVLLAGCVRGERVGELRPMRGGTPRDAHALRVAATADSSALQPWEDAAARALRSGLSIAPSFRERVLLPVAAPVAVAYRFPLMRGQSLRVQIRRISGVTVFAEVFHAIAPDMFRHVLAARSPEFDYTAPVDGEYVLRLQPPVGSGAEFDVSVFAEASLLFPVAGAGLSSIGGVFGDPRDGGARSHEGVDIFAPRGTPVVAVTAARVEAVRTTRVGGRVVWLSDEARGLSYYYAHLDEQRVRDGAWVAAGDTIGTVGNTGNAATTPPHLHFGVYRPGTIATDPAPLLRKTTHHPATMVAPVHDALLGRRVEIAGEHARLRASPANDGAVLLQLRRPTEVLVIGAVGDWQRVVLDDGTTGFVAARFASVVPLGTR